MGTTGLIFAAIAAFWLVYLVPYFLHRRGAQVDADPLAGIVRSVTMVSTGRSLAQSDPGVEVSTPLTRRAQLRDLKLMRSHAARRRRRVLVFLLLVQVLVGVLAVFGVGAWWGTLIPALLIAAFLVIARFSVRSMDADLARRADRISAWPEDEETVAISLSTLAAAGLERSVEVKAPTGATGSLWDPVPITRPTYVSTPLAPRTVRTIDLSAPLSTPGRTPVTADPLQAPAAHLDADEAVEDVG